MQQMLEDWYNKSTNQHLQLQHGEEMLKDVGLYKFQNPARACHEEWLQSPPDRRAILEPAYIQGDRKVSAVESVLRTELLDVVLKPMAEACVRHGYCTAELIIWYIMKLPNPAFPAQSICTRCSLPIALQPRFA